MKNLSKRTADSTIANFQTFALNKKEQKEVKGGEDSIIVEEILHG